LIVQIARSYRAGFPIPTVEYTESELATWKVVYTKLRALYPTHACSQMNRCIANLEANGLYSPDFVPQLQVVSDFLHDLTGWRLRPVMGLLTSREFLNSLAFRVFQSTQYIRHPAQPWYTPEPDACHDLIGHVPMFCDTDFADFSQQIGLASLGVSDEDIKSLSTLYWFTVEFGLCYEEGKPRAYGAGLLSSYGELEHCLSPKPQILPFDPKVTSVTPYVVTQMQDTYFITSSFEDAKKKLSSFAAGLSREFGVTYNPLTENIEILNTKASLIKMVRGIDNQLKAIIDGISKLEIPS